MNTRSISQQDSNRRKDVIDIEAGFLTRFRDKLREQPPMFVFLRALDRVTPRSLFAFNRVYVVTGQMRQPTADPSTYAELRWATPDDIDGFAAIGFSPDTYRARFARGGKAAMLESDGRVVAYEWCEPRSVSEDTWLDVGIEAADRFYHDLYVVPDFRRQGIGLRLKHFMDTENMEAGYERVVAFIMATNLVAQRTLNSRGVAPIGCITFVRVLGLKFLRAGGKLRIGLWSTDRRLDLSLDQV